MTRCEGKRTRNDTENCGGEKNKVIIAQRKSDSRPRHQHRPEREHPPASHLVRNEGNDQTEENVADEGEAQKRSDEFVGESEVPEIENEDRSDGAEREESHEAREEK